MATSLEFKIPSCPSPMPTMGSDDEESFVVLGKSLIPDVDLSFKDLHVEPLQSGLIEEGKKLINLELSQLEISTLPQMPSVSDEMQDHGPRSSITTISSELSPEEIQQKVDILIRENVKLRETIMKNNSAMEAHHERIVAWKEEVQKTHLAHKLKFAEAKDFISRLKSEKDFLTHELEKSSEIREMQQRELFKLKDDLKQKQTMEKSTSAQGTSLVLTDLNNEETRPDQERSKAVEEEMVKAQQKVVEMEKMLQVFNLAREKLLMENARLRSINATSSEDQKLQELTEELNGKKKIIEGLSEQLKTLEASSIEQIETLNLEIINLRTQLCQNIHIEEDFSNTRKQLLCAQATITALQQNNDQLKTEIEAEKEKVAQMKELETIKDHCYALQQQIDVYKTDFEAEREAKQSLQAEKDQIINDFLEIQKRNNELNEEIELLRERGFVVLNSPQSNSNASRSSPQGPQYSCPICNFRFTSYQALENHVERCMDISASLP